MYSTAQIARDTANEPRGTIFWSGSASEYHKLLVSRSSDLISRNRPEANPLRGKRLKWAKYLKESIIYATNISDI
jgi:hypothetical protein